MYTSVQAILALCVLSTFPVVLCVDSCAGTPRVERRELSLIQEMESLMLCRCLRVFRSRTRFGEWTSQGGMSSSFCLGESVAYRVRRDVTDHLQLLLRKSGYHLHTSAEKEVVRMISALRSAFVVRN